MPGSSFRASSREDSISSSLFGDSENFMNEDAPIVISQRPAGEWDENSGLGISPNDDHLHESSDLQKLPTLLHEHSAPARMEHKIPLRQRSSDKIRAKRESIEKHRHECTESGDDEDEELGDANVKERSPRSNTKVTHRGSKLGIEMMRTNSRGSVVSVNEMPGVASVALPPVIGEELPLASQISGASLTPPEIFTTPGRHVSEIDLNETPRPLQPNYDPTDEEPTPRAPSASSNRTDYIG
jgi:serine/threonine-protein kinase RIM15